jgi:hypothetical protein
MKCIISNYHVLQLLKTATPKLRKAIISNTNSDLIKSSAECILNVLYGNVTLTECGKRKLRKHKTVLCTLADKRVPLTRKKKNNSSTRRVPVATARRCFASSSDSLAQT